MNQTQPCPGCGGTGVWPGFRACLTCDGSGERSVPGTNRVADLVMARTVGR